jgi:hypothetical protein
LLNHFLVKLQIAFSYAAGVSLLNQAQVSVVSISSLVSPCKKSASMASTLSFEVPQKKSLANCVA